MDSHSPSSWQNLPSDLLCSISELLKENSFDNIHIRAVCQSWRRSVKPQVESPKLPVVMCFKFGSSSHPVITSYILYQTTVYLINDPETQRSWLVKFSKKGIKNSLALLNPFTKRRADIDLSRVCDLLKFGITEVHKYFTLEWMGCKNSGNEEMDWNEAASVLRQANDNNNNNDNNHGGHGDINNDNNNIDHEDAIAFFGDLKVEISSNFDSNKSFLVTDEEGYLHSVKCESNSLQKLNSRIKYRNIVNYKGDFYCIDRIGFVHLVNDFSLIQAPQVVFHPTFFGEWYLIKAANGGLFMVGRDLSECLYQIFYNDETEAYYKKPGVESLDLKVDFRVFGLNGIDPYHRWSEVRDLGQLVLFVSRNCSYAFSTSDIAGCEGNCIIFVDDIRGITDIDEDDTLFDEVDELDEDFDLDPMNNVKDGQPAVNTCDCDGGNRSDEDDYVIDECLGFKRVGVFNLNDGTIKPLKHCPEYYEIFWPPPTPWINSDA